MFSRCNCYVKLKYKELQLSFVQHELFKCVTVIKRNRSTAHQSHRQHTGKWFWNNAQQSMNRIEYLFAWIPKGTNTMASVSWIGGFRLECNAKVSFAIFINLLRKYLRNFSANIVRGWKNACKMRSREWILGMLVLGGCRAFFKNI